MYASMPINEVYGECVSVADAELALGETPTANFKTLQTSSIASVPSKDFTSSASTLSIISESNESSSASSVSTCHSNSPVTPSETELSIIARYEVDTTTRVVAKPHSLDIDVGIASREEKEGITV